MIAKNTTNVNVNKNSQNRSLKIQVSIETKPNLTHFNNTSIFPVKRPSHVQSSHHILHSVISSVTSFFSIPVSNSDILPMGRVLVSPQL